MTLAEWIKRAATLATPGIAAAAPLMARGINRTADAFSNAEYRPGMSNEDAALNGMTLQDYAAYQNTAGPLGVLRQVLNPDADTTYSDVLPLADGPEGKRFAMPNMVRDSLASLLNVAAIPGDVRDNAIAPNQEGDRLAELGLSLMGSGLAMEAPEAALRSTALRTAERPRLFYRGTNPGSTERIKTGMGEWDGYLFAADNEDAAKFYGSSIEKISAKPEAKIIYEGTKEWVNVVGKWRKGENLLQYADRAAKAAKEAGYDAAWFKMQGNVGTAIFNENAFIRNFEAPPSVMQLPPPKNEAEAEAAKVLTMLRAGRASEVTDDMMAKADPAYLFDNYDLPMDEASRMTRAREMGFDTETKLYHGTPFSIQGGRIRPSRNGIMGSGVYTSTRPETAEMYSDPLNSMSLRPPQDQANIVQLMARRGMSKTETYPFYDERGEIDGMETQFLTPDPRNIRSTFARFDPRLAHLSNLNAANAAPTLAAIPALPTDDDLRAYFEGLLMENAQ